MNSSSEPRNSRGGTRPCVKAGGVITHATREPVAVQAGDFDRQLPPALKSDAPASPMKDRFGPHFETMPRYTTMPVFGAGGAGSAVRLDAEATPARRDGGRARDALRSGEDPDTASTGAASYGTTTKPSASALRRTR
jgi:hypothetical protein